MNEMQDKAQPDYIPLAARQKMYDAVIIEQNETKITQNEQIIALLMSLNKFHGDADTGTNWLQEINRTQLCEKKNTKQHRSKTFTVLFAVVSATIAFEFFSTGTISGLDAAWTLIKGML